jgi:hypothetical protein
MKNISIIPVEAVIIIDKSHANLKRHSQPAKGQYTNDTKQFLKALHPYLINLIKEANNFKKSKSRIKIL